jgi:prepilin-type processing-associated H-X9-DG protein
VRVRTDEKPANMRDDPKQLRMDILAVLAALSLLSGFFVACQKRSKDISSVEGCYANMKQLGGAFGSFALEHERLFPMAISTNRSGSSEYRMHGEFTFMHFRPLSNWLVSPLILKCPKDSRSPQAQWVELQNKNISYFIGLDAEMTDKKTILSGDRHLNGISNSVVDIQSLKPSTWNGSESRHGTMGNILFSDGGVRQVSSQELQNVLETITKKPYRVAVP